ncbi:MAG TPA: ABC transporter substrate-binding protein [Casimicrobiaceae bacterium]|nr:ABC transporter substrate-binding protein [Casimicrobiaceae bacterium]
MNRRRSIGLICGATLGVVLPARGETPTYKVGVTPTGIPFTYLDPESHTIQGAMADVVRFIGAQAGFAVSFEPAAFGSLIPMLSDQRIDLIGAAMLITAPRRALVDFSDPVFAYREGLVVGIDDATPYRSLAELKGKVLGAQAGTVYAEFAQRAADSEPKLYPSIAELLRAVSEGRLGAALGDAPVFAYQLLRSTSLRARLVPTYVPQLTAEVAIAMRKGDATLLATIDDALAKLRGEGIIERIGARWNVQ